MSEGLKPGVEVLSDEGSLVILKALQQIAWDPELTAQSPEWETEIKARLTDFESGHAYYVSSDSRYLGVDAEDIDEIPRFNHVSRVGRASTPLLMIEKDTGHRTFMDKMPFALYPYNFYAKGPRAVLLHGTALSIASELGTEKRKEFTGLIERLVLG